MRDILLALCVGAAFTLGALPMRRLDRFLEKRREAADGQRRRENEDLPTDTESVGARPFGRGLRPTGAWRGSNLFPLRHRS